MKSADVGPVSTRPAVVRLAMHGATLSPALTLTFSPFEPKIVTPLVTSRSILFNVFYSF